MKLIIIHGPPAAGKLTVARELAARTGYKLFHNHLSIDCVKPVFEFASPPFMRMIELIRFGMIAEAAHENVDMIHTFVYAFGEDDEHFTKLIASAEDNGGAVHLVLLRCDDDVRRERIVHESRKKIGKLTDPDSIETSKELFALFSTFPGRETLVIDTTMIVPGEAASRIIEHYGLRKMRYKDEKEIAEVIRSFEDATISRDDWKHAEHLTVALYYLCLHDMETATEKMRSGIFKLLGAFGVDLSKEMPYHETLTIFWIRTLSDFNATKSGDSLLDKANELVSSYDKDYPLQFYSREFLFSDEARAKFVGGDLA